MRGIMLDLIDKRITQKIYRQARKQEELLAPDCFTAYYTKRSCAYWFLRFLILVLFTLFFSFWEKIVLYLVGIPSIGCFIIFLHHISYRCFVDDTKITVVVFWFLKKQILWKDIRKVQIQEYKQHRKPLEKNVILRNKQNKVLFTCSYDLVGYTFIAKKAKHNTRKH